MAKGKAKAKRPAHKRKAPIRVVELPLDDPRWRPVREEFKLISQYSGHRNLAVLDLNEALANGRVRSRRRHTESGERERLPSKFWVDHKLELLSDEGLLVVPRLPDPRGFVKPVRGFAFFLWHPNVEEVWPALRQADEEVAPMRDTPPGTKPTRDWPILVAAWLILKACEDPHQLENIDTLVGEAQDYLQKKIGWAPQNPQRIRQKIKDLLQLIRR